LLQTLKDRKAKGYNFTTGQGDIYRCVKDSNLIAVRLLLDFLGLKAKFDKVTLVYSLFTNERKAKKDEDDIKIDQFRSKLLSPTDLPRGSERILAGVYIRADKELAHLTSTSHDEFNTECILIQAATIVEDLMLKFLYAPHNRTLPDIDR